VGDVTSSDKGDRHLSKKVLELIRKETCDFFWNVHMSIVQMLVWGNTAGVANVVIVISTSSGSHVLVSPLTWLALENGGTE